MKSLKTISLLLLASLAAMGQSELLDGYIKEGLANNEAMHEQNFQLQKSVYALKEATGMFFPKIDLNTNYTDAHGGRTIDVPLGDLMNPVYANLNQINAEVAPGSKKYPQLQNISEQLNPVNFYDAYFSVSLPIINAEIWYNRSIKKDLVGSQQQDVNIYKRELVKDIKTAYFNYLKAVKAISIYENALTLVKESERVNQKLVDNGKEVVFALSRSKSEVSKIEAQLDDAQNTKKNAAAYFNFLLNKPLDGEIATDENLLNNVLTLPDDVTLTWSKREELSKLMLAQKIDNSVLQMSKGSWIPKVGAQLDLGSQASDFQYNSGTRYYLLGVTLDWRIFSGMSDVYKVQQAKIELNVIDAQTKYAQGQLKLAATSAANSYLSAKRQFASALDEENTSVQYFDLMNKRYKEGQALYIEFLDARNENTQASLQRAIRYFDAWIKYTELERANAGFNLTQQ